MEVSVGKIDLVKKTDEGVITADGYTVKISLLFKQQYAKSDTEAIQALYDITRGIWME